MPGARMPEIMEQLREGFEGILDPVSLLSKMIWFHLRYDERHTGYARLLLLECRSHPDFYKTASYGLVRKYAGIMLKILEEKD